MGQDPELSVLKALADDSRYELWGILSRSSVPMTTAELAEAVGRHPNTVRPHLERLRRAGLVERVVTADGAVGRPRHRYRLAAGREARPRSASPRSGPWTGASGLDGLVMDAAAAAGVDAEEVRLRARHQAMATHHRDAVDPVESLLRDQADRGFAPALSRSPRACTVAFTTCPYRELAEAHPELVCAGHQGLVEGVLEAAGGPLPLAFRRIDDREACRVEVAVG